MVNVLGRRDNVEHESDRGEDEEEIVERQVLDGEGEVRGREAEKSEDAGIPELRAYSDEKQSKRVSHARAQVVRRAIYL